MFDWLEYSPEKDAAYCLSCIFSLKFNKSIGAHASTTEGFRNWKQVNNGMRCAFLGHIGNSPCSPHNNAVKYCNSLMNQSQYIDKVIDKQTSKEKLKNRLRLKASIDCVRYLTSQGCVFRGYDECPNSKNCGNFLELIKLVSLTTRMLLKLF